MGVTEESKAELLKYRWLAKPGFKDEFPLATDLLAVVEISDENSNDMECDYFVLVLRAEILFLSTITFYPILPSIFQCPLGYVAFSAR